MALRSLAVGLVALLPLTANAQRPPARWSLGAGVAAPIATSGSPSFLVAVASERREFAAMRIGGEVGYISLGRERTELAYALVTERWRVHRGLWYAGWIARATDDESRRPHWLALTGIGHLRRTEVVTAESGASTSRSRYVAHATGPTIALGLARRVPNATVETRITSTYFMDEGFVTLLTATAWLARRDSRDDSRGDRSGQR